MKSSNTSALVAILAVPVVGLFWAMRQRERTGAWEAILACTGGIYLVVVSRLFENLYFGIVIAHFSFAFTIFWYGVIASEIGNKDRSGETGNAEGAPILASVCIPVVVFQIMASGSQIFSDVSMESCGHLMRSWLVIVFLVSSVLLIGRRRYWRAMNWLTDSLDRGAAEMTVSYMLIGLVAAMISPFFLSGLPNPIQILVCMFH